MRITILTQSDPFYLADNINYLITHLPDYEEIVSTVLFDVSPFGKQESFIKKVKRTINIFGFSFFLNYGIKYLINRLIPKKSVRTVLKKHKIPIIKLSKSVNHPESLKIIKDYQPDLLISIAGNQIFKQPLIDLAPKGCLNLHTALLPKYRGLMPSFWVLKNGEKETGVSIFFIDKGIDSGPILVQKKIPIEQGMTQADLIKKSKNIGMDAIIEAVELIHKGNYRLIPNPNKEKTYYSFPTKKDVKEFYNKGGRFF
jgi:methionyl-tRNA formyltransferase